MRILLADDSELILERLTEMLGIFEQAEIVASLMNGTETLEKLRILKPDLAILDIRMPGLNGLEIISEFRKENKTIKFIILTLFSSGYYRQAASDAGADYFFNKLEFEKISLLIAELIAIDENHELIMQISVK
jgi:DNA-binding NarL/FixJ family response regulator